MAEYVTGGLETSFTDILAGMFADYQARMPSWIPKPGSPECVLMEVIAVRHAVRLDVSSQVLASIYTYFGASIAGVPFNPALPASANATFLVNEAFVAERQILPRGFRVALPTPEGEQFFEVSKETIIEPGEDSAIVTLVAQEPGSQGNGLTEAFPADTRTWIQSITLISETSGGSDEEEEADYRNRLVAKERRDGPTIITAVDAQEALLEIPGIGRCLILDNYVPAEGSEAAKEGVPGAFTAVVADENGANVSSELKAQALAVIDAERLLDLKGYVINPTRTNVAVAYTFDVLPGYDPGAVKAAGDEAIERALNDATWGRVTGPAGTIDWEDELLVRYSELYAALNAVEGLNHVLELKLNGTADKNAVLVGPGALPTLTSVVGTLA